MKETGTRRTENGVFCEKCGNDLMKDGSARFVMHWDGTAEYGNVFECGQCGARIEQVHERVAEDAAWWAEDGE